MIIISEYIKEKLDSIGYPEKSQDWVISFFSKTPFSKKIIDSFIENLQVDIHEENQGFIMDQLDGIIKYGGTSGEFNCLKAHLQKYFDLINKKIKEE